MTSLTQNDGAGEHPDTHALSGSGEQHRVLGIDPAASSRIPVHIGERIGAVPERFKRSDGRGSMRAPDRHTTSTS